MLHKMHEYASLHNKTNDKEVPETAVWISLMELTSIS